MSINFSCNQYENAFKTLKNWEVPKGECNRYPLTREGFTQIVANDRGHLTSGVPKSRSSPWGGFVGTWDMPTQIPGNCISNGTARSGLAVERLQRMKTEGNIILSGQLKKCKVPAPLKVKDIEVSGGDMTVGKPATPKSAGSGRLSGAGDPLVQSRIRSGAENPVPGSKFSPQSVHWPYPDGSRLEKPLTPQQMAGTPPPRGATPPSRRMTPITFPLANGPCNQGGAPATPDEPVPLQSYTPQGGEPVDWPMPEQA